MNWEQAHSTGIIGATIASFIVIALVEMFWPAREARVSVGLRWRVSGCLFLLNTLISLLIPLSSLGTALYAAQHNLGLLHLLEINGLLAVLIAVPALDLGQYLLHRWLHRMPLLWRVHEVHHTDNDYDLSTGLRFHPIETLLTISFRVAVALLLGPPVAAVLIYEVWATAAGFYGHANARIPPGIERLLRLVLVTPTMHCIHHSLEAEEVDSNFSSVFSVWDRLLGTYTPAPRLGYQAIAFGLAGQKQPHELKRLFAMPFVKAYRAPPPSRLADKED